MAEEKENAKEGVSEKKSSPLVLIIIIVLVVLILLIGGIVAYMVLSKGQETAVNPDGTPMAQTEQVQRKSANELTVGPMFPLDQFIVNLLSENNRRFLKVAIDLELDEEDVLEELGTKIPRIRDIVIRVLSSKSLEEISTPKGKEKLKKELIGQLNAVLLDGQVVRIYFTDFVIQ
jgi:flagellar FliL protein